MSHSMFVIYNPEFCPKISKQIDENYGNKGKINEEHIVNRQDVNRQNITFSKCKLLSP